ncbi:MAG TPA: ABC transporter permease, partial [Thermoanaerobaculia bacterium]
MRETLVIAAREVRERSLVLAFAAFSAVAPFIILNLRTASRRANGMEFIGVVGAVAATCFALAMAVILGVTIVGRDLSERRLSFYFARPVSGSSIWFGKLLGAIVVVAASFAIIFVPSLVAGWKTWYRAMTVAPSDVVVATSAAGLFLLLGSHVISTIIRSRSAMIAVDFAGTLLFVAALLYMVALLLDGSARGLLITSLWVVMIAVLAILAAAGAWQLSRGRTDVRRGHIEMSKFVWSALAVVMLAGGAYVAWVVSAEPEDLTEADAFQSARGDWAVVSGTSNGRGDYQSAFLSRVATGDYIRMPAFGWYGPDFTRNGDAAYTMSSPRAKFPSHSELLVYRLDRDKEPVRTGIVPEGVVVMSDDLSRIGIVGATVAIHDIDGNRLLASARLPGPLATSPDGFFVSPNVLRTFHVQRVPGDSRATLLIHELDATKRQIVKTGSWSTRAERIMFRASADGSSLLVNGTGDQGKRTLLLLDGRTGAVRAQLEVDTHVWQTRFLSDGRVVALTAQPHRALRVFSAKGEVMSDVLLGPAPSGRIAAEDAQGRVIVALYLGKT